MDFSHLNPLALRRGSLKSTVWRVIFASPDDSLARKQRNPRKWAHVHPWRQNIPVLEVIPICVHASVSKGGGLKTMKKTSKQLRREDLWLRQLFDKNLSVQIQIFCAFLLDKGEGCLSRGALSALWSWACVCVWLEHTVCFRDTCIFSKLLSSQGGIVHVRVTCLSTPSALCRGYTVQGWALPSMVCRNSSVSPLAQFVVSIAPFCWTTSSIPPNRPRPHVTLLTLGPKFLVSLEDDNFLLDVPTPQSHSPISNLSCDAWP